MAEDEDAGVFFGLGATSKAERRGGLHVKPPRRMIDLLYHLVDDFISRAMELSDEAFGKGINPILSVPAERLGTAQRAPEDQACINQPSTGARTC